MASQSQIESIQEAPLMETDLVNVELDDARSDAFSESNSMPPTKDVESTLLPRVEISQFDELDADDDGFVNEEELESARVEEMSVGDARRVKILQKHYSAVQRAHNDEPGFENDGITVADIETYARKNRFDNAAYRMEQALEKRFPLSADQLETLEGLDRAIETDDWDSFEQLVRGLSRRDQVAISRAFQDNWGVRVTLPFTREGGLLFETEKMALEITPNKSAGYYLGGERHPGYAFFAIRSHAMNVREHVLDPLANSDS